MKKYILGFCLFGFLLLAAPSCSPKYGCPINESTHGDMSSSKGGNSQLFPKHMRKKKRG